MDHDDREHEVSSVLVKGGAALVALCALIALGTFGMVKFLGLDSSGSDGTTTQVNAPASSPRSLPTTALPVPGGSSSSSAPDETFAPPPTNKGLQLTASPLSVGQMERINLTGQYPGHDNVQLKVQRRQGGAWTDFPVTVVVRMGTFATYVKTGHSGENEFRVVDPGANKTSNAVKVTVQ